MRPPPPPALPPPDARCGEKIDYVARRLALLLAPLGYKRRARLFTRSAGEGDEAHWQLVQLQGDQWNEGARGAFFVNLGVQFPALTRLAAARPGMDWLLKHLAQPDVALAQARERLGQLQAQLPAGHPRARPPHSDEFKFDRGTDLAALADGVAQAVADIGLPWLQQHASLRALANFDGSLLTTDVDLRIAAAVLLGDRARAQQILSDRRARFEGSNDAYLKSVRAWFEGMGLDTAALPQHATPPLPGEWELRRRAAQAAEEATHAQQAEQIRAEAARAARATAPAPGATGDLAGAPKAHAAAWLAEHRAQWRRDPDPLTDLPSGRDIAALDAPGREAVLCALLQALAQAEAEAQAAPVRDPFQPKEGEFDTDTSVRALIGALLPTLPAPAEATLLAVMGHLQALVTRWQHELVTGGYPWGFALLVRWLTGPAGVPHRATLQPAVAAWLQAHARHALASHDALIAASAAQQAAAAADPAHPLHEVMREAREREAELAARQALPSPEAVRQRMAAYPEQRMHSADRQAVALLRQLLKRDPASGRLPVAWDGDDWGQAAQQAWQAAPPALREAFTPLMQQWLEGVETRPSQTFLRTLRAQQAALAPALSATGGSAWVLQQLAAFSHSSGQTEWATTGPRPGVGARLGDASEALLTGLLWWAWLDPALAATDLSPVLQQVAEGAWQRLPEVGARAVSIGGLVLRMQAGLDDTSLQHVAELSAARGTPKQLKQAAQRALKDPLTRG